MAQMSKVLEYQNFPISKLKKRDEIVNFFLDKIIHSDVGKLRGHVFNIGTGKSLSIKEIAEIIINKMNKPKSVITFIDDRPGQVFRHTADIKKIRRHFFNGPIGLRICRPLNNPYPIK